MDLADSGESVNPEAFSWIAHFWKVGKINEHKEKHPTSNPIELDRNPEMNSESEEISFVWICLVQVSTNPERDSMRVRINSTMDCSASLISFHGKASTGPESDHLEQVYIH